MRCLCCLWKWTCRSVTGSVSFKRGCFLHFLQIESFDLLTEDGRLFLVFSLLNELPVFFTPVFNSHSMCCKAWCWGVGAGYRGGQSVLPSLPAHLASAGKRQVGRQVQGSTQLLCWGGGHYDTVGLRGQPGEGQCPWEPRGGLRAQVGVVQPLRGGRAFRVEETDPAEAGAVAQCAALSGRQDPSVRLVFGCTEPLLRSAGGTPAPLPHSSCTGKGPC